MIKVIVTSYNNEDWVETNIESILEQNYSDYKVMYFDDCSTDKTFEIAHKMLQQVDKFELIKNPKNLKKSKVFAELLDEFINDDDIVVFIDGDDWLADSEVFKNLDSFYKEHDCWVTYGGMVCWNGGEEFGEPNPQNSLYPDIVHDTNTYRLDTYRASHLKTMKGFIFNKIDKSDFKVNDEYITFADDLILMCSAMEMSPKDKIKSVDFRTYVYNEYETSRLVKENKDGMETESIIRGRKPYKTLSDKKDNIYITTRFAGALGNQMFELAAAYSLGLDTGVKVKGSLRDGIFTLHNNWPERMGKYLNTIFRKVEFTEDVFDGQVYGEPHFHYKPISWKCDKNLKLEGHFQSEKHFSHNREQILDLFEPTDEIKKYINDKYGNLLKQNCVSLHIRRKEYKDTANDFHPLCSKEYYQNAMSHFPDADVFLVFSDEIGWCKENLKNPKFIFIENEEDITDLYLMSMCKDNIIANSSYSWWSAWLNTNEDKKIIAPSPWFGKALNHDTGSLLPDEWTKIPIGDFNKENAEGVEWNI